MKEERKMKTRKLLKSSPCLVQNQVSAYHLCSRMDTQRHRRTAHTRHRSAIWVSDTLTADRANADPLIHTYTRVRAPPMCRRPHPRGERKHIRWHKTACLHIHARTSPSNTHAHTHGKTHGCCDQPSGILIHLLCSN